MFSLEPEARFAGIWHQAESITPEITVGYQHD
jgi:hypothetical protein